MVKVDRNNLDRVSLDIQQQTEKERKGRQQSTSFSREMIENQAADREKPGCSYWSTPPSQENSKSVLDRETTNFDALLLSFSQVKGTKYFRLILFLHCFSLHEKLLLFKLFELIFNYLLVCLGFTNCIQCFHLHSLSSD